MPQSTKTSRADTGWYGLAQKRLHSQKKGSIVGTACHNRHGFSSPKDQRRIDRAATRFFVA